MKRLCLITLFALLMQQGAVLAHQENHVHSLWIKRHLSELYRKIDQLNARINRLESGKAQSSGNVRLDEVCPPGQQRLCRRNCPPGWKISDAVCIGQGNIGKNLQSGQGVTCYCLGQNDPNCRIDGLTASCVRR